MAAVHYRNFDLVSEINFPLSHFLSAGLPRAKDRVYLCELKSLPIKENIMGAKQIVLVLRNLSSVWPILLQTLAPFMIPQVLPRVTP